MGVRGAGRLRPRVLVTRPQASNDGLVLALEERGLEAIAVPTVAIAPPPDGAIDELAAAALDADWLVVTSANAVPAIAEAIRSRPVGSAAGVRIAAIGSVTAEAVRNETGLDAWIPDAARPPRRSPRSFPSSRHRRSSSRPRREADDRLAERLRERGATVRVSTPTGRSSGPAQSREPLRTPFARRSGSTRSPS